VVADRLPSLVAMSGVTQAPWAGFILARPIKCFRSSILPPLFLAAFDGFI